MRAGLARGFTVPRVTLKGRDVSIAAVAELRTREPSASLQAVQADAGVDPRRRRQALRADARRGDPRRA